MSDAAPKQVDGVLLFGRCLQASSLAARERLVLGVGMLYQFDFRTWRGFMSQEQIKANCGLGIRTVQDAIKSMKDQGVLTVLRRGCGRSGKSSEYQLNLDVLAGGHLPAIRAGIRPEIPANGCRNTGKRLQEYRQATTEIPAAFADPQLLQTHSQTTITNGVVRAPIPPTVPVGVGDGGGASPLPFGSENTAERGHCPQESERLLVDFGVSRTKAASLAFHHSPGVVRAGMTWVRNHAANAESPAGLLASRLEDGTAVEQFRRDLARRLELERDQETRRLAHHIRELFTRVYASLDTPELEAQFKRAKAVIMAVWPNPEDAARAGPLTEADFADPAANPRVMFNKLCDAAKRVRRDQRNQGKAGAS